MRRGITLIEVVCGIALLGSLLTGLLLASTAHLRQMHEAHLRVHAAERLNEVLVSWSEDAAPLPLRQWRHVPDEETLVWTAAVRPDAAAAAAGLQIVQVSIWSQDEPREHSLASVDLVLPDPDSLQPAGDMNEP